MKQIFIIPFLLLLVACSLPHDNPLDPENSGIPAPSQVSGITIDRPQSGYVPINWDSVASVDGYYIYRSQSYYGDYVLHKEITDWNVTEYHDDKNYISGNWYYYILSAYKIIDDKKFEGTRSRKVTWN